MKFRGYGGNIVGSGHRIVHERPGEKLSIIVILTVFHEHLSKSLANSAVHLSMNDWRIDDRADIVNRDIAVNGDFSGFWLNFDFADMAAVGKVHVRRYVVAF